MLENLPPDSIKFLRAKPSPSLKSIRISKQQIGALVRAVTRSGNCYFFEIVDPKKRVAHVVRCDSRPCAPDTGYCGTGKVVTPLFEIGKIIKHYGGVTSSVIDLSIFNWSCIA